MTFVLREGMHVLGVWFVAGPGHDVMAMAYAQDGKVWAQFRFRRVVDDRVWDSKDSKEWHEVAPHGDTPEARAKLIETFDLIAAEGVLRGYEASKFEGGPSEAAIAWLEAQPFSNSLTIPFAPGTH